MNVWCCVGGRIEGEFRGLTSWQFWRAPSGGRLRRLHTGDGGEISRRMSQLFAVFCLGSFLDRLVPSNNHRTACACSTSHPTSGTVGTIHRYGFFATTEQRQVITPLQLLASRDVISSYTLSMAVAPFKAVRFPSILGLQANYCPFVRPSTLDEKAFVSRWHPRVFATRDKYARASPDALSWWVVSGTSQKVVPQAVVRNRLKRRWANAFADSMRQNGFHANGKLLSGPKDGKSSIPGLKGSLELLIYSRTGLDAPYDKLVQATDVLVKTLRRGGPKFSPDLWPRPASIWHKGRREDADSTWSIVKPQK